MKRVSVKKLTLCALLIALSFVLANVKIMGTVALDSLPAFLGGLILGGIPGAIIGGIAHMFTAGLSGFPLTLPVHLIIAAVMALTIFLFTITYNYLRKKHNKIISAVGAGIVGTIINGPFSVLVLSPFLIPTIGKAALIPFALVLTIASIANIVLAFILFYILDKTKFTKEFK